MQLDMFVNRSEPAPLRPFKPDTAARKLARNTDPATSHEAAERVREFSAGQHAVIHAVLADRGPSTAHEIAAYCRLEAHKVGKRMKELETAGRAAVVLDGDGNPMTRQAPSGRSARVWFAILALP